MKPSNRVNLINKFGSFLVIAGFSSTLMWPAVAGAKPGTKPAPATQPSSVTPTDPSSVMPTQPTRSGSSTSAAASSISCEAASNPSAVPSSIQTVPGETLPATPGTKGSPSKPAKSDSMQMPAQPPTGSVETPNMAPPTSVDSLDKPTAMPSSMPMTAKKDNLIARAESKGSFKTLVAALKAADLTETLACKGPYTVFAPTDAAFAALPKGTLEKLLKPENKAILIKLLTYHVVSGEVLAKALKAGSQVTIEGNSLTVKLNGKQVMINNAKVVQSDVTASNGVIHAIDKVVVPPDLQ